TGNRGGCHRDVSAHLRGTMRLPWPRAGSGGHVRRPRLRPILRYIFSTDPKCALGGCRPKRGGSRLSGRPYIWRGVTRSLTTQATRVEDLGDVPARHPPGQFQPPGNDGPGLLRPAQGPPTTVKTPRTFSSERISPGGRVCPSSRDEGPNHAQVHS